MDNQKVIFKYNKRTIGEIEMRNDSEIHYRQINFWMLKEGTLNLLKEHIIFDHQKEINGSGVLCFYGSAKDSFLS